MKRRFSEAMKYMDEKYLEEAVASTKRHPATRWIAMAASLVLILGLGLGIYYGQHKPTADAEVIMPPSRIGKTESKGTLYRTFTFQEAYQEAETVAWIRVGNWLGENLQIGTSYFEAEVIACYKGDMPESIVLEQVGNSEFTYRGYHIFANGNEMVLFLKNTDEVPYENCYWIIGAYSTLLDVVKDADGNVYAMDTRGFLGQSITEIVTNHALNQTRNAELCSILKNEDSIWENRLPKVEYIFLLEDLFIN